MSHRKPAAPDSLVLPKPTNTAEPIPVVKVEPAAPVLYDWQCLELPAEAKQFDFAFKEQLSHGWEKDFIWVVQVQDPEMSVRSYSQKVNVLFKRPR